MRRRPARTLRTLSCSVVVAAMLVAVSARPAAAQAMEDHQDPSHGGPAGDLVAHVFGSVLWGATQQPDQPNSFELGQLALFATSAINDHISVLAEVVMEASAATTEVTVDLERLQLTYYFNDHLNVSAGRYHTGIGFYNAAFHHGSYFEIPIGRPRVFAFEDEGGVLPIHEVGISVRGKVPRTGSALRYVAEVGNGRRWIDVDKEDTVDQNDAKSTNVGLSLRPEIWRGAEVGGSFYRDDIPNPAAGPVAHRVAAAYGVYRTPSVELMAEWLRLSHRPTGGSESVNHGGYVQASKAFGTLRPYYRYDRLEIDPRTPLIGEFPAFEANILGLRIDRAEWVGLKAQYERVRENHGAPANGVRVQLVFVF